jgi:hypothetical protein
MLMSWDNIVDDIVVSAATLLIIVGTLLHDRVCCAHDGTGKSNTELLGMWAQQ